MTGPAHNAAVDTILARYEGRAFARGFAKAAKEALGEDYEPDAFNVVPDAWMWRPHPEWPKVRQLVAFEVEDAHRITPQGRSVAKYVTAWWVLDDTDTLDLQVIVVDRWGGEAEIDMSAYCLSACCQDEPAKRILRAL